MRDEIYRYRFAEQIPMRDAQDSMVLAVIAAESLHGRSQVRLDTAFQFNEQKRHCDISAGTDVGRQVAQIFTGFLAQEFGEEAFRVERLSPAEKGVLNGTR